MTVIRYRSALAPLGRLGTPPGSGVAAGSLPGIDEIVLSLRPDEPLHCLRPQALADAARRFAALFPGDVLYAVKCNPEADVLRALHAGGVTHFDAASLTEVKQVRGHFPDAVIHFMHPVKARSAIREAYAAHGVRDFSLDSLAELRKIEDETDGAPDLGLIVRLAMPKGSAVHDLSGKFGAAPAEAVELLRTCRRIAARVGLSFHVGSQCLDPEAYERALDLAGQVLDEAGIDLDVLDVGGGFPVSYPDETPPDLELFMTSIRRGVGRLGLPASCRLWCEPGRALVAAGQSVVVRVLARKQGALYINDGVYGALSDAGAAYGFRFPVRLIRADGASPAEATRPFELFGPTCDSADRMKGPFLLPDDVGEGDWIEIGQLGAYGGALRTAFNGFDQAVMADVRDPPLLQTPGYQTADSQAA